MTTANIDWTLFDRRYPVENGIVNALPPDLTGRRLTPNADAKRFDEVHKEVMQDRPRTDLLKDQKAMASLQMDFYDRMALAFQSMDDTDQANGGVFWWKVRRIGAYDAQLLENAGLHWSWQHKKKTLLFVGAGNGRLVRFFTQRGFNVVATDISRNMLEVGKKKNESLGITNVTYVAQNAEIHFPFKTDSFDSVYSLCVMNHIVNWNNYITEKLRCVRRGGIVLERLPNADLWQFWKMQGVLYEGIEKKAAYCNPDTVRKKLRELNLEGEVWTHDHQPNQQPLSWPWLTSLSPRLSWLGVQTNHALYAARICLEDIFGYMRHDGQGIYTMFRVKK